MNVTEFIKSKIVAAAEHAYSIRPFEFVVEHPENQAFGDYATNVALVLSKTLKQKPMEVAKKLCYEINDAVSKDAVVEKSEIVFESIEVVAPGFINFKISPTWLQNILNSVASNLKGYGAQAWEDLGKGKRIALEHSNVNPNKAAHVGHLRNACIGQFIERIYESMGYEVDVQYYANNVGVQVATSVMGVEKIKSISPASYKKYDHYAWDVYAEMESQINISETLKEERLKLLEKLDDPKSPEAVKQKELAKKILLEQLKTFEELGFDYDVIIFESDVLARKLWEKAFEKLKVNSNVYYAKEGQSAGCWLVRLGTKGAETDSANVDVAKGLDIEADKIIVRSNGVATYTGKDIAYHMWKFGLLGIDFDYKKWLSGTQKKDLWVTASDESDNKGVTFSGVNSAFDVIGAEQTYAINVVKRALEFLGYPVEASNMKHINYGFVFLSKDTAQKLGIDISDGKKFYAMSGRRGWGVKIDDLIDMTDKKLEEEHGTFESKKAVRTGAIKFSMLRLNTFQDLVFDLEEALDMKGYSGPYIQYACVRAGSVLKKAGKLELVKEIGKYNSDPRELEVLRWIYRFPEIIQKAAESFAPNLLCDYLFELAKRFNAFYNDLPILNAESAEEKAFRLKICTATKNVLSRGLWLLGIDAPDRM